MPITGYRSETNQFIAQVVQEGADAVCYKPFDMPNLLATLRELVGVHDSVAESGPA